MDPLLPAVETEPGVWLMVAQFGQVYGIVRLAGIGGEHGNSGGINGIR